VDADKNKALFLILRAYIRGRAESMAVHVAAGDGRALWKRLLAVFAPDSREHRATLAGQLGALRAENNDVPALIDKMDSILAQLRYANATADDLARHYDTAVVTLMQQLRGMPFFRPLVFKHVADELIGWPDLCEEIRLYIDRSPPEELPFHTADLSLDASPSRSSTAAGGGSSQQVFTVSGKRNVNKTQGRSGMAQDSSTQPSLKCHYCKKPGHVKRDCRKLQRDLKSARALIASADSPDSDAALKPGDPTVYLLAAHRLAAPLPETAETVKCADLTLAVGPAATDCGICVDTGASTHVFSD
jgi:hypothetical protein